MDALQPNPFATNQTYGVDHTEVPKAEAEAPDGFFGGDGLFGGGGIFGPYRPRRFTLGTPSSKPAKRRPSGDKYANKPLSPNSTIKISPSGFTARPLGLSSWTPYLLSGGERSTGLYEPDRPRGKTSVARVSEERCLALHAGSAGIGSRDNDIRRRRKYLLWSIRLFREGDSQELQP